jgi:DNA-binding response OmpR family regulator
MNHNDKALRKILVADDDEVILEILEFNLLNEGYAVLRARSAEEAIQKLSPDCSLILLDVMMGGMSGYKLAESLRNSGNNVPIIFLTARDSENDMLTGFSAGGDDYIPKPFSIKEVLARIKAVLKRTAATAEGERDKTLVFGDVTIDLELKEFRLAERCVPLTRTEFELIALLSENPGRTYSREEIIGRIRSETPYITERTIDVHVTRLRKKLGTHAWLVSNRTGFGYKFNVENPR